MSAYNYDLNPWDDNYDPNAAQNNNSNNNQRQQPGNYGGYTEGYSNPAADYSDYGQTQTQSQQYQYQDETQQQQTTGDQPPQPPAPGGSEKQHSFLGRFVRERVPACAPILDTLSSINLPFIDALVQRINRDLLVSKMFYFFFYSAFGSLFPLMGVYFKQQGMNPAQVGILTGVRPFIEIFSAPFWNSLAARFQKSKALLLFSLLSWIVFTYSLAHIRTPPSACVAFNDTDYVLYTPYSANDLGNYEVESTSSSMDQQQQSSSANEMFMNRLPSAPGGGGGGSEKEGKDQILASEENQNDQRRRRRRSAHNIKDVDDVLGESDESEPEEQEQNANDDSEQKSKEGSAGVKDDDRESGESEEQEEERESVEQGKQQRDRESQRGNSKPSPAATKATTPVNSAGGSSATTQPTIGGGHDGLDQPNGGSSAAGVNKTKRIYKQRHKTPPTHIVGMSPITVEYAVNYNKEKHSQFVTPMFSTIVYKLDDIKEVFFLLLLLISLGEFFSAPALTLADSATLSYLGDNTDSYGRQRMFGSFSWAVTLLLVGMALDNATSIADHPCGPHQRERSYTVCFVIFSLLMACAFLTATQFKFNYPKGAARSANGSGGQAMVVATNAADNGGSQQVVTTTTTFDGATTAAPSGGNIDQLYASTQPRSIFNTAPPVNAPPPNVQQDGKEKFEFLDKWRSAVFAQRTWELPEWVKVFRQFNNPLHLTYLFITWFLGLGVGLVFTFLFWHLQDVGGTPTLFGICSVINHISEILAYFFSFSFIKRFGHTRVLSVGLGCNVIRFLYVAFLTDPYYALPFEMVQGITHAACFAACCSYMSHVSKPELRTSTQGVMQGLHHGIGRACGALLGGYMINAIGSRASFCIYGLLSGCVLTGFLYIRKKASESISDEEVKVDDSEALGGYGAPQGVPSAIPGKIGQTVAAATQDIDYQW